MRKLDTDSFSEGARYLALMRRRMWQCQLAPFVALLVFAPCLLAWHVLNSYLKSAVLLLYLFTVGACLLLGTAAWFGMTQFRCPRCGKGFIAAFGFGPYRNHCKHCGLYLGPALSDKAKPPKGGDLLE
jgi:hypothetical protein